MLNNIIKNGNGNGSHPDTQETLPPFLWDGLPPAAVRALEEPLDPALVSHRKGRAGRAFPYIEGHTVIDEANRIFGYGGWGYDLVGDVVLREVEQADAKTGELRRFRAYTAVVRVMVPGAQDRTDVGYHAVAEDNADGHETAVKGAVTDGMKRALRSFGQRFGNGLYGDQPEEAGGGRTTARQTGRNGGSSQPQRAPAPAQAASAPADASGPDKAPAPASAPDLRQRLIEIAVEQGFDEDGVRAAVTARTGKGLDDLDAAELAPLVEAAAKKLQEAQGAKAA